MLHLRKKVGLLICALLMASVGVNSRAQEQSIANQPAAAQDDDSTPAIDATDTDYKLGPADKLRVIVFGEESLSGEFIVSGTGKISLPLIGDVQVAGLTIRAFQDEVQNALKAGYLKDPRVSAEVLNFRPYYILGEVSSPGRYPFTDGLTVINAVAAAGGFTYRAKKSVVYIKRINDVQEHKYALSGTTRVMPGDTIRIPERIF